jgi:hypothetical protein
VICRLLARRYSCLLHKTLYNIMQSIIMLWRLFIQIVFLYSFNCFDIHFMQVNALKKIYTHIGIFRCRKGIWILKWIMQILKERCEVLSYLRQSLLLSAISMGLIHISCSCVMWIFQWDCGSTWKLQPIVVQLLEFMTTMTGGCVPLKYLKLFCYRSLI